VNGQLHRLINLPLGKEPLDFLLMGGCEGHEVCLDASWPLLELESKFLSCLAYLHEQFCAQIQIHIYLLRAWAAS
jgi:hypothetical protein